MQKKKNKNKEMKINNSNKNVKKSNTEWINFFERLLITNQIVLCMSIKENKNNKNKIQVDKTDVLL